MGVGVRKCLMMFDSFREMLDITLAEAAAVRLLEHDPGSCVTGHWTSVYGIIGALHNTRNIIDVWYK